jgi:tRNA G37 N-methylase TrmD
MRIDVLTLFPAMLDGFLSESMMGRAQEAKLMEIKPHVKPAEARAAIAKVDGWVAQMSGS